MKIQNVFASLMIASLIPAVTFAEETPANESKVKIEKPKTTVPGDIDNEITNARLRAVSGAKSDWSFSSSFNYSGSSILSPFSTLRPQFNPQNGADPTNANGQLAIKYRVTEHNSLLAGFGVQYTPGYTDNGTAVAQQTTASSPYIDYNRAFRTGAAQHVIDVAVSKYTLSSDIDQNLNLAFSAGDQVMFNVADSKLELGAALGYSQDLYDGQALRNGAPRKDYIYSQAYFEPIAEYAFNDKINLRTVFRMYILNQSAADRTYWASPAVTTESLGVGFAVTRDVYLYPSIQWAWDRIAADATTVGFSANINL